MYEPDFDAGLERTDQSTALVYLTYVYERRWCTRTICGPDFGDEFFYLFYLVYSQCHYVSSADQGELTQLHPTLGVRL